MTNSIIATVTIVLSAGVSNASFVVDNDTNVSFSGALLDGIVGSGIDNSDFEVATNATENIEIGLKAIERFVGDVPSNDGTYFAPIGEDGPGLAEWNYVLVADFGSRTVTDFDIQFEIDFDAGFGVTDFLSIDVDASAPLVGIAGLSQYGDSQNLGFNIFQLAGAPQAFDPNAVGEYDLTYTVFEKGTSNVLARTDITVVVPAPGAAAVACVVGLTSVRRRR